MGDILYKWGSSLLDWLPRSVHESRYLRGSSAPFPCNYRDSTEQHFVSAQTDKKELYRSNKNLFILYHKSIRDIIMTEREERIFQYYEPNKS